MDTDGIIDTTVLFTHKAIKLTEKYYLRPLTYHSSIFTWYECVYSFMNTRASVYRYLMLAADIYTVGKWSFTCRGIN